MCGLHFFNDASNNPRSKYKHEIARCNFWNSKYMIEIELGENDTALVQGATRAVSFSPRSISTKYSSAKSQKPLGCASRFLRLPRGILLKTLSTISKTSRLRLEVFEIVSRVLSPYTSRFKNYIVRFHIKNILEYILWIWRLEWASLNISCISHCQTWHLSFS